MPGFQRNQFGDVARRPVRKNKTFVFGNFEGFRQHLHQTGVDLVPDANARLGYLPCKLVTPGAEPLPRFRPGVRGSFAADQRLARAQPGAPDFGGISEAFNNPLQTIRDDFGTVRLDHIFSSQGFAERGLHHRRQRRFHAHQHQRLQHRRGKPARAGGQRRRDAHLLADAAQHRARRLFARRLFLHRRAYARHARRPSCRAFWRAIPSARSWWAAARRRIPPRS